MTLFEELQWRGFVNQTTFTDPADINEPRTFYLGVDPSAHSMTVGNLAAVMLVKRLVQAGHKAIVLVGGATGMIGDPKNDSERELKTIEQIERNKEGIAVQYRRILGDQPFELVDNYDWFKDIGYLDFLRDIGKQFSMTQLLDRDFVQSRIGDGATGISYAEFSYSLIQGYDYLHLYREKGVTLQIGGSDQWGNMLSGVPLIRRNENAEVHVWTIPLVINKTTGKKFGKSEDGAVWLDPELTSPFRFYQFWLNVDDAGVVDYLKIYTMLGREEIEQIAARQSANPGVREAQKTLAKLVTNTVHGNGDTMERISHVLFENLDVAGLSTKELDTLAAEIPVVKDSSSVIPILVESGIATSNGEARRLIEGGAISVNGVKIDSDRELTETSLVKKGKNTFVLVRK